MTRALEHFQSQTARLQQAATNETGQTAGARLPAQSFGVSCCSHGQAQKDVFLQMSA